MHKLDYNYMFTNYFSTMVKNNLYIFDFPFLEAKTNESIKYI